MNLLRLSKLSTYMLPLIFIVLISTAIFTAIVYVEKQAKLSIHKSLFTVLTISQEALQRWADNHLHDLVHITDDANVLAITQRLIRNQDKVKRFEINRDFKRLMSQEMKQYTDQTFLLLDTSGNTLASKFDSDLGIDSLLLKLRKPDMQTLFAGNNVFIPPVNYPILGPNFAGQSLDRSVITEEPTAFVGAPIFNEASQVIAVLILGFNPMVHFTRITELGRIGNTGETYAFDKTGLLITKSRFTQNLKLLGMLGEKNMAMLSIRITDPGVNLAESQQLGIPEKDRPLTLMADRAIQGDRAPYYDSYRDYRGESVFGAWMWSKSLGIGLATEIDENEALESFHVTRFVFLSVLVVIILLTLGLAFLPLWFKERERDTLRRHKNSLEKTVRSRTEQLEQANHKLKILSELDSLTQIANRRLYNRTLIKEVAMAGRTSEPLSLLMIDIDYFKLYNDNYGHDHGDVILQEVAKIITSSLNRTTDFAARYGGEEFVAILPATNEKGAMYVADRIRENIAAKELEHIYSHALPVITVSVGVACLAGKALSKEALFQAADLALYKAKELGRNQVVK